MLYRIYYFKSQETRSCLLYGENEQEVRDKFLRTYSIRNIQVSISKICKEEIVDENDDYEVQTNSNEITCYNEFTKYQEAFRANKILKGSLRQKLSKHKTPKYYFEIDYDKKDKKKHQYFEEDSRRKTKNNKKSKKYDSIYSFMGTEINEELMCY